jgi:hypothetical protein
MKRFIDDDDAKTSSMMHQLVKRGNLPIVAYACATPPVMPPNKPANAGLIPAVSDAVSTSEAVKINTAPLVDASIHA